MARIALLGGSFNPPHIGHQMVCLWALSSQDIDRVWLLPCVQHAMGKDLAPFEQRVQMCQLALQPFDSQAAAVSTVEQAVADPKNRTLLTIEYLQHSQAEHTFSLLIGSDILAERQSWYRFDEIERRVAVIVVGRGGYGRPQGSLPMPEVSSSEVRARLQAGDEVAYMLPKAVEAFIRRQQLYGT